MKIIKFYLNDDSYTLSLDPIKDAKTGRTWFKLNKDSFEDFLNKNDLEQHGLNITDSDHNKVGQIMLTKE
jgi:hypothetical protein